MEEKRKAGRPKAHNPLKYRNVRVSDSDWATIQQAADSAGLTLSEWVRQTLLRAAKRQGRAKP